MPNPQQWEGKYLGIIAVRTLPFSWTEIDEYKVPSKIHYRFSPSAFHDIKVNVISMQINFPW